MLTWPQHTIDLLIGALIFFMLVGSVLQGLSVAESHGWMPAADAHDWRMNLIGATLVTMVSVGLMVYASTLPWMGEHRIGVGYVTWMPK